MTSYRLTILLAILLALSLVGCESEQAGEGGVERGGARIPQADPVQAPDTQEEFEMSDERWKAKLTPEQYRILREKGTEQAFTGKYWNTKSAGTYRCAGCGLPLFSSETKYDSRSGWPSFWAPVEAENVAETADHSLGGPRTEVLCGRCGSHLGHVFEDGPQPTGQRYCVNSASLELEEE